MQVLHHRRFHPDRSRQRVRVVPRQRVRGHPRPLGLGQDHAAQHRRRPRPLRLGQPRHRRHLHRRVQGPRLGRLPQQPHRLRVPKLQPHPPPDGALQRGAGAHAVGRVARRAARARDRGPEEGGPGRPREQEAEPALRRPDAARGHRPRPHQRPRDPAGRRAHRRARLQDERPDHGPAHRDRERSPGHHGHAQPRTRRAVRHAHREPLRRRHPQRHRPVRPHRRGPARKRETRAPYEDVVFSPHSRSRSRTS